jgi:hypothetical protein
MGQEKDPTGLAPDKAWPKMGPASQRRPQCIVVRQDQVANLALAMPPRKKRETFLDGYQRKPRVSDRMLRLLCMLSSCRTLWN